MALQSGSSSPCAACKLLRRKCVPDQCIFAPYFPPEDPQKFVIVHKIFGACNVNKLLKELPVQFREDAVNTLAFEAEARVRDPVYGCVAIISFLHRKLLYFQHEIVRYNEAIASLPGAACANDQALNAVAAVVQEAQQFCPGSCVIGMGTKETNTSKHGVTLFHNDELLSSMARVFMREKVPGFRGDALQLAKEFHSLTSQYIFEKLYTRKQEVKTPHGQTLLSREPYTYMTKPPF